jgi:multiple sugar transport system permease protein
MKDAMEPLPSEYIEAARVDGAGEFWIFLRIVLPMVKTAVVTFFIIKLLWTWNEYFWPLIVINTDKMKTITLGLSTFSNAYFQEYSQLSAAVVLSLLPILVIYVFTRRFIVQGMVLTGLKS